MEHVHAYHMRKPYMHSLPERIVYLAINLNEQNPCIYDGFNEWEDDGRNQPVETIGPAISVTMPPIT